MSKQRQLENLNAKAKARAKLPADDRVERDMRAATLGSQTPLVGAELLKPEERHDAPATPLPDITEPKREPQILESIAPAMPPTTPDQNQVSPAPESTGVPSKKNKRINRFVQAFLDQKELPEHGVITILKKDPKKQKALIRFQQYKDGMTVKQYVDHMKTLGVSNSQAKRDVRWDFSKGFINVVPSE